MLFNSIDFALFLPLVFLLHWLVAKHSLRWQNGIILLASYVFYGMWDWRFLGLMLVSSLTDYYVGLGLEKTKDLKTRKLLLGISLVVNIGMLGFFKYFNFFVREFIEAASVLGFHSNFSTLNIILPIGISFYTFQTIAYSMDVYRGQVKPERNLVKYLTFVSFFPQLVAGPIERSKNLLPQFGRVRKFDYKTAVEGLRQVLWGFVAKLLVADNLAPVVKDIFNNYTEKNALTLALGAALFTIQIYGDFSGYSNIAIGSARLFGIRLSTNFQYPLFARDIAEFWQRWHISLSSWCRDYIYKPLRNGKSGKSRRIINTTITFIVIGIWHGANWTFLAYGLVHGLYLGFLILIKAKTKQGTVADSSALPSLLEIGQIVLTFSLVALSSIFFGSESLTDAFLYFSHLFDFGHGVGTKGLFLPFIITLLFLVAEWVQRSHRKPLDIGKWPLAARWCTYIAIVAAIVTYGEFGERSFIYFQF